MDIEIHGRRRRVVPAHRVARSQLAADFHKLPNGDGGLVGKAAAG